MKTDKVRDSISCLL